MRNFKITALALLSISFFTSCSSDDDSNTLNNPAIGNAEITFDSRVANADFALDTPFTINNNSYQFENLRYWVSNVELINSNNEAFSVPNSFYLIEETKEIGVQDGSFVYPATKRETVKINAIPSDSYSKIRFSIGVDATHNGNLSLQSGELSQLNGMTNVSWMWHTSYIFSSLKGKNTATNTAISVETGLNTNYRTVEVILPSELLVTNSAVAKIVLNVDVAKILQNVDLTATPTVSASTPAAMTIVADNFGTNVFSVKIVE